MAMMKMLVITMNDHARVAMTSPHALIASSGLWMKIIIQKRQGQGISPNPECCDVVLMNGEAILEPGATLGLRTNTIDT